MYPSERLIGIVEKLGYKTCMLVGIVLMVAAILLSLIAGIRSGPIEVDTIHIKSTPVNAFENLTVPSNFSQYYYSVTSLSFDQYETHITFSANGTRYIKVYHGISNTTLSYDIIEVTPGDTVALSYDGVNMIILQPFSQSNISCTYVIQGYNTPFIWLVIPAFIMSILGAIIGFMGTYTFLIAKILSKRAQRRVGGVKAV